MGSPPHTRDKYNGETSTLASSRIIPAYAGQMMVLKAPAYPCWDHPRIRGTNRTLVFKKQAVQGSSPHTRDKYRQEIAKIPHSRITPAYAGQISILHCWYSCSRDHPRIRGTNVLDSSHFFVVWGSSPHTRDKSYNASYSGRAIRIIPAYAGQINLLEQLGAGGEDHPRIRGTNARMKREASPSLGSSPHTRDKWISCFSVKK